MSVASLTFLGDALSQRPSCSSSDDLSVSSSAVIPETQAQELYCRSLSWGWASYNHSWSAIVSVVVSCYVLHLLHSGSFLEGEIYYLPVVVRTNI